MSSALLPSPKALENLSTLYMGFVAATVLYGLTFFQTYMYYTRYPRDRQWIKYFVATLCILDTTASALFSQVLYYYLIILYDANVDVLLATTTFCVQYILSVLLTFLSQLFFAHRVFQVTGGSRPMTLIVTFLSFIALVFGLTASGQMIVQRRLSAFGSLPMEVTAAVALVTAVVGDIITFATMCYSLRPSRYPDITVPRGVFPIVVAAFVGRGLAPILAQTSYFFVFITAPSRPFWIPLQVIASKFYVNTLLGHLNARDVRYGRGFNEEVSLVERKPPPTLSHVPVRVDVPDAKATTRTQTILFTTQRTDSDSAGTEMELDSRKTYQDEHGNTYAEVSIGSTHSHTGHDEVDKASLSEQLN